MYLKILVVFHPERAPIKEKHFQDFPGFQNFPGYEMGIYTDDSEHESNITQEVKKSSRLKTLP